MFSKTLIQVNLGMMLLALVQMVWGARDLLKSWKSWQFFGSKKLRMCEGINTWPPLKSTQYDSWYPIILTVHHSRTLAKLNEFVGSSQNLSLYLSFHLVQKWWKPSRWKWKKWKGGVGSKSQSWTTFWVGFFCDLLWAPGQKAAGADGATESGGSHLVPRCVSVLKIRFLVLERLVQWFLDFFFQTDFVGMDFWDEFGMEFMKWYKWSLGCFRQISFKVSFFVMNITAFSRKNPKSSRN